MTDAEPVGPVITYRQALQDTLRAELVRDENVFLMGEEIGVFEGSYKITAGLLDDFGPTRVRDTPICEEGFVGAAIGAAMLGLRPVVEIMTINFSLLALDQIVNHAAKMHTMFGGQVSVPMVIRTPGGGDQQLAATHSKNLEVWYAHVPGLKVVAPATPADAKALLTAAISVEVVDLRSLRPLDRETICASVRKTTRAVVLEDDWLSFGIGAEVAASIGEGAFDYLDAPVRRVAAAEVPLPYAKPLELAALPDAAALLTVIHQVLDDTRFTALAQRHLTQCSR